jgi:hypothetical protein
MALMFRRVIALTFMVAGFATPAQAFESEREIQEARQAELDFKCEAAREEKLMPERLMIMDECLTAKYSTNTEEDCRRIASTYNGNRINGSPRYYDFLNVSRLLSTSVKHKG